MSDLGFSNSSLAEVHRRINNASRVLFSNQTSTRKSNFVADWSYDVLSWGQDSRVLSSNEVPRWMTEHLKTARNIFIQLPPPDRRWFIRYRGVDLPLIKSRSVGFADYHSLIARMPLEGMERSALSPTKKADAFFALMEQYELVRLGNTHFYEPTKQRELPGHDSHLIEQYKERLKRAQNTISLENPVAGAIFKDAVKYDPIEGFSFTDVENWVTDIAAIPYDARVVWHKDYSLWTIPGHETFQLTNTVGLRHSARLFDVGVVRVPCGLLVSHSLAELLTMPPYHRLFTRTLSPQHIIIGSLRCGEIGDSIAEAKKLQRGQYYVADHQIAVDSPLVKFCDFPTGFVNLGPEGMAGIIKVLARREWHRITSGTMTTEFQILAGVLRRGYDFVMRYEREAQQIESLSNSTRARVKMAIDSARNALTVRRQNWNTYAGDDYDDYSDPSDAIVSMSSTSAKTALRAIAAAPPRPQAPIRPAPMTSNESGREALQKHIREYIVTGKCCQYIGPWMWDVQGLPDFPNVVELAEYHHDMKTRRMDQQEKRCQF